MLNEMYSKIGVGKYLSDNFALHNSPNDEIVKNVARILNYKFPRKPNDV
jgi:hypothetical protein